MMALADVNPFLAALSCDLVVEKLVSFLPLEDVKVLTLVSRDVLTATRGTKEFATRVKLNLTEEAFQTDLLAGSVYRAKHVYLELFQTLPFEKDNQLGAIIGSAESLHLSFPRSRAKKSPEEMTRLMKEILTNSKNLRELRVETEILNNVKAEVFGEEAIQQVFRGLDLLEIAFDFERGHGLLQPSFRQSLQQLLGVPLILKKFSLGMISLFQGRQQKNLDLIPRIIEGVKDTLEELEILEPQVWMLDEMKGISCPALRSLTLSAIGGDEISSAGVVDAFLRNQPHLEELVIAMCMSFPRSTLEIIGDIGSKLKKLHIQAKQFSGGEQLISWEEFLGRMTKLRDFALVKPYTPTSSRHMLGWERTRSCKLLGEDILRALPPNMERISLEGFKYFWGLDRLAEEKNVGLLLSRFRNLTGLSLRWSPGALTDDGLQTLITRCSKLTYLDISQADNLTNYGVTGIRRGELAKTGASLDELKGLTHLKIINCPKVSPGALLPHLKFDYLRSLEYVGTRQVGLKFLLQVAQQNPCLENISIDLVGLNDPAPPDALTGLKAVVLLINSRARNLDLQLHPNREKEHTDEAAAELLTSAGVNFLETILPPDISLQYLSEIF